MYLVLSSRSRAHQPFSDNSFALPAQNAQQRKITNVLLLIRIAHITPYIIRTRGIKFSSQKKTRKNYKDLLIVNSAPKSRGFFTVVRLYTVPFSEIVNSTFRFGEVVKIVDLTTRFGAVFRYRKSYGAVRCFDT